MPFTHRVYFSFFARHGWVIQFSPPTLDRALGRIRTVETEEAVREMIRRTPTRLSLEDWHMLDEAFKKGRGGLFLELTDEQYQAVLR
jgi:hypothetical protein